MREDGVRGAHGGGGGGLRDGFASLRKLLVQDGDALKAGLVFVFARPRGEEFFEACADVRVCGGASGGDAEALEEGFIGEGALEAAPRVGDQRVKDLCC